MHARFVHMEDGSTSKQLYGRDQQAIYSVSRAELNKKLVTLAEQEGTVIHFNSFCSRVDLKNKTLHFSSGPGDTREIATTGYELLFGADGVFSALRNSMQFLDRYNYQQHFIEHGYKELTIAAGANGSWRLEKNFLHIWPRHQFMLIALPNLDGSFTCTLFFPFEGNPSFSSIKNEKEVQLFFEKYFPDIIPLMPDYQSAFTHNPVSSLAYISLLPVERRAQRLPDRRCSARHRAIFRPGNECRF